MRSARFVSDLFCLFLGLGTLGYWITYLAGGTFNHFTVVLLAGAGTAVGLAFFTATAPDDRTEPAAPRPRATAKQAALVGAAAVLAASSALVSGPRLSWPLLLAAAGVMGAVLGRPAAPSPGAAPAASPKPVFLLPLLLLAAAASVVTLVSHRPDADDEFYVGVAVSAEDQAGAALRDLPVMGSAWGLASYQMILAVVSRVTGIPLLYVYYLVAPALVAFVSVLIAFRLFRELIGRPALLATAALVVVLMAWGDLHRSPGNFAFVRLFQGKAVFCVAVAPALLLYAVRVWERRTRWEPALLGAALAAGIGATQTIVVIGPLFLLMVAPLLMPATWRANARLDEGGGRMLLPAIGRDLAALWPVGLTLVAAGAMLVAMRQGARGVTGLIGATAVEYTLGSGLRAALGLASLVSLPLFVRSELRAPCAWAVVLMAGLGLSPGLAYLLDFLNASAVWRITWVMPFAPATAAVLCAMADGLGGRARVVALSVALAGYAWLGPTTLGADNDIGPPRLKLPRQSSIRLRVFGKREYPVVGGRVCLVPQRCY